MSAQELNEKHFYWCKIHGIKQRITALQELYDRLELSGMHLVLSQIHHLPIYRHYQVACFEEVLQVTLEAPLLDIGTKQSSSLWKKQHNEDEVIQLSSKQLSIQQRPTAAREWLSECSSLLKLCFHVLEDRAQRREHAHEYQSHMLQTRGLSKLFEIKGEQADLEQIELSLLKLYAKQYLIKDEAKSNLASHSVSHQKLSESPSREMLPKELMIWSGFSKNLPIDQEAKSQPSTSCSYWLKLHTVHTEFIKDFEQILRKYPHLSISQFKPLLSDLLWQNISLEEQHIIRPYPSAINLLIKLAKQHYTSSVLTIDLLHTNIHHIVELGELRESFLSWRSLKEIYQSIALNLDYLLIYAKESQELQFKKTPVLPTTPIHSFKIDLKWENIKSAQKSKTSKAQALLIKTTTLSQRLTDIIANRFGPQILAKVKVSFLPNLSRYTIAWFFEDLLLSVQLNTLFESIDLADHDVKWMSHYTNRSQALNFFELGLPSLGAGVPPNNTNINIWIPTGLALHPHVPYKDLLSYLLNRAHLPFDQATLNDTLASDHVQRSFQNLWILDDQETSAQQKGHLLCLCSKSICKSLDETYKLDYSSRVVTSLSPLSFLEPIQFEIDHESSFKHNKAYNELETEFDHIDSADSELKQSNIIQEDAQGYLEQEHLKTERAQHKDNQSSQRSTAGLRAELRALTRAHLSTDLNVNEVKDFVSPKQKAQAWLKNLNENVPRLLSTQSCVEDWLSFAQHLWWLEEFERAIDALVWMYISYMLEPQHEKIQVLLAGWQSRLLQSIPYETNLLKYARISLYTCFLSPIEKLRIYDEHYESINALRLEYLKATRPKLHLVWLVNHCLVSDQLLVLQSYEWTNRILALGLSTEHCDSIIQQQLSNEPMIELGLHNVHQLELDQNDPTLAITSKRLRTWGHIFIDKLRTELFKFQSDYDQQINRKEFVIYRQLGIATQGLKNILYGQPFRQSMEKNSEEKLNPMRGEYESISLDDEVSQCLFTRYELGDSLLYSNRRKQVNRPKQVRQGSQCLSILRNDPQLDFWRQHSSLNQRSIEATPLGASFKNSLSPPHLESQPEVTFIEASILGLSLTQALRRLRPQVRSYHSFKKVISFSIDQSLMKHDLAWLEQALKALERWVEELDQIATVPYEVLTQLDFEYLRLRYALSHSDNMQDLCTAWVSRWFVRPKQDLNWRKVITFQQEFSTRVLDKLSAYVSPKVLIETVQIVSEHLLKIYQELKEKEVNYPLADMHLEQAQYQVLLATRSIQFKSEMKRLKSQSDVSSSKTEQLEFNESNQFTHSIREFVDAFCDWIEEYEQATQQPSYVLKKRFQSPLSTWLYHLQYFTVPQLNQLSELMLVVLQTKTLHFQARAWYIFEDAFLSKPLFQSVDHPRLKIWLRTQERAIRQVWQKSIES